MNKIQYVNNGGGAMSTNTDFFRYWGLDEYIEKYKSSGSPKFGEYSLVAEYPCHVHFETYGDVNCVIENATTGEIHLVNKIAVKGLKNDFPTNKKGEKLYSVTYDEQKGVELELLPCKNMPSDFNLHPQSGAYAYLTEAAGGITQTIINKHMGGTTEEVAAQKEEVAKKEVGKAQETLLQKVVKWFINIFKKG